MMTGTRRTSSIADTQFMSLLKTSFGRKSRKSVKPSDEDSSNTNKDDDIQMDTDVVEQEEVKEVPQPTPTKPVKKAATKKAAAKTTATINKTVAPTPTKSTTKKAAATKKVVVPVVVESSSDEESEEEEEEEEKPTQSQAEVEELSSEEESSEEEQVTITKDTRETHTNTTEDKVPKAKEEDNINNKDNKKQPTVNNIKRSIIELDPTRGKPVSGRVWKTPSTKFIKSIAPTKGLKTTFEIKQKQRLDLKRMKEKEREIKEKTKTDKANMHNAIRENKRIKEENLRKSEVVQVINNTKKLKKLSKKDWLLYRKN